MLNAILKILVLWFESPSKKAEQILAFWASCAFQHVTDQLLDHVDHWSDFVWKFLCSVCSLSNGFQLQKTVGDVQERLSLPL